VGLNPESRRALAGLKERAAVRSAVRVAGMAGSPVYCGG
jgi:hypothetical protein